MADLPRKILKNITDVFENDSLLDEYDFLPVPLPEYNRNPVIVEQHKLAIESWAVKVVFLYCYERLIAFRRQHGFNRNAKLSDLEHLAEWSRVVVMVTADCTTAWNIRKELLNCGHLDEDIELALTQLVLIRHPKSSDTFYQRKWLLSRRFSRLIKCKQVKTKLDLTAQVSSIVTSATSQLPQSSSDACHASSSDCTCIHTSSTTASPQCCHTGRTAASLVNASPQVAALSCPESQRLLEHELELCQAVSERYANNYHAWTHRVWVLQHGYDMELLQCELSQSDLFLRRHVSDHSAYHYRQHLLKHLSSLHTLAQHTTTLRQELDSSADLIRTFPGHEAVWYHRRALLCQLKALLIHPSSPSKDKSLPKKLKTQPPQESSLSEVWQRETEFCDNVIGCCQLYSDTERVWQKTLAERHKTAMERTFNVDET